MNFLYQFPLVKFHRICLTGSKYLTLQGSFSREIYNTKKFAGQKFFQGKSIRQKILKDKNLQKKGNFTNPTLFMFNICFPQEAMCRENFGRFYERKIKKITKKAKKKAKNSFVWPFIIQDYNSKF